MFDLIHYVSGILRYSYHLGIFFRSDIHEIVVHRILRLTFKSHFVMQMGSR